MRLSTLACSLVTLISLLAACTTVPFRPNDLAQQDKRSFGRIAIVGAGFQPEYNFDALTTGQGDAAAKGALGGAGRGVGFCAEAFRGGGANIFSVLFFAVCAPVAAVTGAVIGGVSGASDAASAEQIEAANTAAQRAIDALKLQEIAIEAALRYGKSEGLDLGHLPESMGPAKQADLPSYAEAKDTADTVIEVSVIRAIAGTTGRDGLRIGLAMQARVRVLNTRTGKEIDTLTIRTGSGLRPLEEWLADDGQAVRAAFDRGAESIAEQALDEILLIYHPKKMPEQPTVGDKEQKELVPPYALRAIEPPIRNKVYWNNRMTYGALERYALGSLQPEFRWEPWPRGFDVIPGRDSGQARNVQYDLRIIGANGWTYERRGLAKPAHRLEQPLSPCRTYRWTVRARFMLDDSPRVTEWMGAYDTMGGAVAPWWFRRGSGAPALARLPGSVAFFYPIIETPGAKCPDIIPTELESGEQNASNATPAGGQAR